MRRVAVAGAKGQLGGAVVQELAGHHEVIALDRSALDIADSSAVERALASLRPDAVVNCAAYNAVDAAEDHAETALDVNAFAVRSFARAAKHLGVPLVHYSTDFVFDGTGDRPYVETDAPNPRSVYAMSKMLGEWFAADVPQHYVLRVESLFGAVAGGPIKGSVAGIVTALKAGTSPKVFVDRTVTPSYVHDVARATHQLLDKGAPAGVYHCVNTGFCTWLDFAMEAARLLRVEPKVTSVRVEDVQLKAPRPKFCALSNEKLRSCGIDMPTWQDALRRNLSD